MLTKVMSSTVPICREPVSALVASCALTKPGLYIYGVKVDSVLVFKLGYVAIAIPFILLQTLDFNSKIMQ